VRTVEAAAPPVQPGRVLQPRSTFDVRADTQGRALDRGVAIFYAALGVAGYDVEQPGWKLRLEIAPSADEPEAVPA
jgi:hypothetical protein